MPYDRTTWVDGSEPAITAERLNKLEQGVEDAHAGHLDDDAIGTSVLADGAVTASKLADEAVTSPKLADEAVTSPKLADIAVTHRTVDHRVTLESVSGDRTLAAGDTGKTLLVTAAATITVPTGLPTGFICMVVRTGSGEVPIIAAGVTFLNPELGTSLMRVGAAVTVTHIGAHQVVLMRHLE